MWPGSDYATFDTGKEPGGGIMKVDKVFPPAGMGITFYVLAESIEDTLSKAEKLGGKIVKEKTAVSDMGWFDLFSDLDGNVIGIWKSKQK
jgi:predicted enzyme related to lactoylglutathione lyase